jgi:ATP synthase protein I
LKVIIFLTVGAFMAEDKQGDRGFKGNLVWASTLGLNLVVASAAGILFGWYLDKWFHTRPVLTIVFFLIGTLAGFRQIYRQIRKMGSEEEKKP